AVPDEIHAHKPLLSIPGLPQIELAGRVLNRFPELVNRQPREALWPDEVSFFLHPQKQPLAPIPLEVDGDVWQQQVVAELVTPFDLNPGVEIRQVEIDQVVPGADPLRFIAPRDAAPLQFL